MGGGLEPMQRPKSTRPLIPTKDSTGSVVLKPVTYYHRFARNKQGLACKLAAGHVAPMVPLPVAGPRPPHSGLINTQPESRDCGQAQAAGRPQHASESLRLTEPETPAPYSP
eukprot:1143681-Rhodomonas_salina.1